MEIKAEELLYRLSNKKDIIGFKQLLVVYGEEDYYRNEIAKYVEDYVFTNIERENREITILEKDTDINYLQAIINTYPFFSGKSLVVIKDEKFLASKNEDNETKKQKISLEKILDDIPEYCTVFINVAKLDKRTKFFKAIKQKGLLCECNAIKAYELASWLIMQAQFYNARFENDALEMIMEYLAPVDKVPLSLLKNEIVKLAIYTGERKLWTKDDVENIFADLPEVSNFKLLDFLGERNIVKVLQSLAGMKNKGENILPICGLILFQLRRMLQFMELNRQRYDSKTIMANLKLQPFVVKKLQQQTRNFQEEKLKQAIIDIAALNVDLRKGGRDYQRLEEILICLLN